MECAVVVLDSGLTPGAPNKESTILDIREVFRTAMMGHSEMRAGVLKTQVKMRYGINSDSTYGGMLMEAVREGILLRRAVSDREVYYLPGPNLYVPELDFG